MPLYPAPEEGPSITAVAIPDVVHMCKISSVTSTVFVKKKKALVNLKKSREESKKDLMFTTCAALRIQMNFLYFFCFGKM